MGNLYMALALIRLKGNKVTLCSAGMPPVLIYREADRSVEEMILKGPPLGGFSGFTYKEKETELLSGDTMLLMSDGFYELFNDKEEMLGMKRAKNIFKEAIGQKASDVSRGMRAEAEKWRNGRAQDDDMTFVVLKIR